MSRKQDDIETISPDNVTKFPMSCYSSLQLWWHYKFSIFEDFIHLHHWKIFSLVLLLLILFGFGLKFAKFETDVYHLWVGESSRVSAELNYLAKVIRSNDGNQQFSPFSENMYQPVSTWADPTTLNSPHLSPLGGIPGSEFSGSMESILQTSSSQNLLTIEALRDHMNLLVKIHKLEVKVGASKWRLEDLCQRAELPKVTVLHRVEFILAQLIPCVVISPADCFWEGSKVLMPDTVVHIPVFEKQYALQWPSLNPHQILSNLRAEFGNHSSNLPYFDEVTDVLQRTGMSYGYLTRPCLDPFDPGCPSLAPNYNGEPPNVARVLANGCPSFAPNILHWSEDLLLGGKWCSTTNGSTISCRSNSTESQVHASALHSIILLRSPQDLYQTVRFNDPYKHESWTIVDAQNVLDQWRNGLKHLLLVHNKGIAAYREWRYFGFMENSFRSLLKQTTERVGFSRPVGAALLVLLYGMMCLLCWRDPPRSQCWLALAGLSLIVLALITGLGMCSLIGLPFNVFSVQVLPFIVLGFGMEGLFVFTTCNTCLLSRSSEVSQKEAAAMTALWTTHVLAEHGTSLVFSTLAVAAAFFSATYLPLPVVRQFSLQAGILVVIQAIVLLTLFPVLLKLDTRRRSHYRMDVLCCLRSQSQISVEPPVTPQFLMPPRSSQVCNSSTRRIVETTSTKVRLGDIAVATVRVSVTASTQPDGTSNQELLPSACLCSSCQYHRRSHDGTLFVRFSRKLASLLSRFLSLRVAICVLGFGFLISVAVSAYMYLNMGLDLLSLTPVDALEHGYVEGSKRAFGLVHFQLTARGQDAMLSEETGMEEINQRNILGLPSSSPQESALLGPGINFARSQARLRKLFTDVASISNVTLMGKRIWLDSMHDWLLGLQRALDEDLRNRFISHQGYWTIRASENGVLGLLLLVQTDNGVDLNRIQTARLVRDHIVDESAFGVYLYAWRTLDPFNYTAPPCTIIPDPGYPPGRLLSPPLAGGPDDLYRILPAQPIQIVQTSFFARGYEDVTDQIELVRKVRALTKQATSEGVPVFPTGLPFTLTEQYLTFGQQFCVASGILLGSVLVAGLFLLPNPVAALLAVGVGGGGAVCASAAGLLLLGLDVNAVSGSLLFLHFGMGAKLSAGILSGWYGPQHNIHHRRPRRARDAATHPETTEVECEEVPMRVVRLFAVLQNNISLIVHANVSLVLAVALLAAVTVDFIADHFFRLTGIVSLACLLNCLIFLPTICYTLEPLFPSQVHVVAPSPTIYIQENLTTSIDNLPPPCSSALSVENESIVFCPMVKSQESTHAEAVEDEEDIVMRRFYDSLKRSAIPHPSSSQRGRLAPTSSSVTVDCFANAMRDISRHASLSTISEEPSNSSSTISLQPPPPPPPPTPHPAAVEMSQLLPLLNAAMLAAHRHRQRRRPDSMGSPPPYSVIGERPLPDPS